MKVALDTAAGDPAFQGRIVEAALDTFDGLAGLAAALLPGDTAARGAALNPEAGRHAITDDPREVRAALRAGVRSWEACPYYERRYGRRGRRFTRSDSAWLVTLAGLPQTTVDRQIGWLARLLAAQAEQVEAALEAARSAAQAQPGEAAGTVRITTTDTLLHGLLAPALAAAHCPERLVIGSAAAALVAARGWGEARSADPRAADFRLLAPELAALAPTPIYGRAPDARPAA